MTTKISAEDQQWRGRDAARTLAEAEKIKNDPTLSKLAAKEAKSMIKEQQESLNAMSKVQKIMEHHPNLPLKKPNTTKVVSKKSTAPRTKSKK